MLTDYEKFRFVDENKQNEFYAEVNWNPKDKTSNECKLIKFTFPDGTTSVIRRDVLNSVLFALGTAEQQQKMIPQTIHKNWWYQTVLEVRAKEDIAKGQLIRFPVKLSMPAISQTIIDELKQDAIKSGAV